MSAPVERQTSSLGRWARAQALLGGPFWWAWHLGAMYWFIPRACRWGTTWPLHVITLVVLAILGHALWLGIRLMREARDLGDAPGAARELFLGWVGIAFTAFFMAVTLAEWFPAVQLDPCM